MRDGHDAARTPRTWRTDTSRPATGRQDVTDTTITEPPGVSWLCTCGHLPEDHDPVCMCRCDAFERGEMLLECGHAAEDDPCDPAYRLRMHCPACYLMVWPSSWEADSNGTFASYGHCGATWTQGHPLHLPRVRARPAGDDRWVVTCPYCGREHTHGAEEGERVAHCHQGDYVITEPPRRRGKLPFRKVWDRDDWTCVTCGSHKNLTVDHKIPVSKGGTDDLDNLQTMCGTCNSSKGNRV